MISFLFCSLSTFAFQSQSLEIDMLIQKLGSPTFAERQEAAKRLEAIGEPAAASLRNAARNHADAEVRRRAETVLSHMGPLARPRAAFAPQQAVPRVVNPF